MQAKALEQVGLNSKEASIYLAALELGQANIQQISKKSGIKRTTAYVIIDALKEKGLISQFAKGKKTLFSATDPRKFEDDFEQQRHVLKRMIPELLSVANAIDSKPKVQFFEGGEGIKEVFKDTLHYPDQELLAWVSQDTINAFDKSFLDNFYFSKRVEKNIWVRAIVPEATEMEKYYEVDQQTLRKTRKTDTSQFPMDVEINLYGKNKIGIMSFREKFGMIIESQLIFNTLLSIFEMNWKALESRNKQKEEI